MQYNYVNIINSFFKFKESIMKCIPSINRDGDILKEFSSRIIQNLYAKMG